MAKTDAAELVLVSPFKTGFFAGLGLCFASLVMTGFAFLFFALLGLGTIGSLILGTGEHLHAVPAQATTDPEPQAVDATPAAAVIAPRPTYHRKTRTSADE